MRSVRLVAPALLLVGLSGIAQAQAPAPAQGNNEFLGPRPAARAAKPAVPNGPAPRDANGKIIISSLPGERNGLWVPGPAQIAEEKDVPFQPWAKALFADRNTNELEPHTRCKPSGVARQFLTPYGVEMVEMRELQRVFVFDIGGPHTFREVFMDGRSHPKHFTPTYYGHSIGWWEGDTLVMDTVGFNEGFWMDRDGLPHTSQMHTIEKFTRTDFNTIRYQLTVDDPGAYTAKFSGEMNLRWEAGTELFEYQCQQMNYASELMVGQFEKVDRSTLTVP